MPARELYWEPSIQHQYELGEMPLLFKKEWMVMKETVRMIERKNDFVEDIVEKLRWRRPQKLTYRATLLLQNYEMFIGIDNKGQ